MSLRSLLGGLVPPRGPGSGSRSGRSYAFTSLTPIRTGRAHVLAEHLRDLPTGGRSPLARLDHVHLGRWLVLDDLKMTWPGAPRDPTRLRSDYLLFTASVTAPDSRYAEGLPGNFLADLATRVPSEADAIWTHCVGYPGSAAVDAFVAYLARSQLDTLLFHVGYPDTTVAEVRHALAARDGLVNFVRTHQDETDPARLQHAYLEESSTWSL
ncbi:MAG: hypothetical protein M3066_00755 [Actinomycetota bacterium]|nr:hypothetical protein [Actinomycetota bacterium]